MDFNAKMNKWVGQDPSAFMTLSVGRVDVRLTPFTEIFKASLYQNIEDI